VVGEASPWRRTRSWRPITSHPAASATALLRPGWPAGIPATGADPAWRPGRPSTRSASSHCAPRISTNHPTRTKTSARSDARAVHHGPGYGGWP